jgi:hypothetical protein
MREWQKFKACAAVDFGVTARLEQGAIHAHRKMILTTANAKSEAVWLSPMMQNAVASQM